MAVIAVLAGGVFGFFGAIFALVSLEISWFAVLGIWWLSGSVIAVLLLAALVSPKSDQNARLTNKRA